MNYKTLFVVSLLINLSLGFYLLRQSTLTPPGSSRQAPSDSAALRDTNVRKPAAFIFTNTSVRAFNWESVESPDYKQYIANLRSVGCPEETIRDIIRADVLKLYEQKKKQARQAAPPWEYWKNEQGYIRGVGREGWTKTLELDRERDSVLRALGIEPDHNTQALKGLNRMELMLEFLGDDGKKTQVLRLHNEFEAKLRGLGKAADGHTISRLIREKDEAAKRLLTPEEALQYDLRMSATGTILRQQLGAFEPTEQEFLAVFKLQKAFDDQFSIMSEGNETPAEQTKRAEAARQLKEQIKGALGPERYGDYELAQDFTYKQIHQVTQQAGLGTAEAKQIHSMKAAAEEQAARVRSDQSLPPEQSRAALDGIRQETERSIQAVLGEKGWDYFNRGGNNRWIERITQMPSK